MYFDLLSSTTHISSASTIFFFILQSPFSTCIAISLKSTCSLCQTCANQQGHREFPNGNSREFPGIADSQNSRREFPGISEILAGITGNFAIFVFFPIFIVDDDILVLNLTAFWAKPWMTSLAQLFVFIEFRYFQILISKNHWTASEFRKLRSLHEGRWDK